MINLSRRGIFSVAALLGILLVLILALTVNALVPHGSAAPLAEGASATAMVVTAPTVPPQMTATPTATPVPATVTATPASPTGAATPATTTATPVSLTDTLTPPSVPPTATPTPIQAPNLVGQSVTTAAQTLRANGLITGTIIFKISYTDAPGIVLAQNPKEGAPILSGGAIDLTVARKPDMLHQGKLSSENLIFNLDLERTIFSKADPWDISIQKINISSNDVLYVTLARAQAVEFGGNPPTYQDCNKLSMKQIFFQQSQNVHTYFCVRTNEGRLGWVQYIGTNYINVQFPTIELTYLVWEKEGD